MAEWSKASDSSSDGANRVGSNPTADTSIFSRAFPMAEASGETPQYVLQPCGRSLNTSDHRRDSSVGRASD